MTCHFRFACLLHLLMLIAANSLAQSSKGDELSEAADQWVEKGDAQKAIKGYLNARTEYLKEKNFNRALTTTQNVAMYYQDTGDGAAAEKLILETIAAVPQANSDQLKIHSKLQDNLAYTYLYVMGKTEDALTAYTKSVQLLEKAGLANTSSYAFELVNRAVTYFQLFQFELCIADMKKAIAIYERDEESDPVLLADNYRTLGTAYQEFNDQANALQSFRKGLELLANSDQEELKAKLTNSIGTSLQSSGEYLQAMEKYYEANKINETLFGKDATHYAVNLINIGSAHKEMGDYEKAMASFQEVLSIYSQTPPEQTSDLIDVILLISSISNDFGLFEESQKLLNEAMNLTTTNYGANSIMQADVYMSVAVAAYERSEFDQSLSYNFKALAILEQNRLPEGEMHAIIYTNVGQAYDELNDTELALKYKEQSLALYKKIFGPNHPAVAKATGNIGLTYEMMEDYGQALTFLKQSIAIREKIKEANSDDLGTDFLNAGLMCLKKNDAKLGVEYLEKAKTIYDRYAKHINKAMIYNRLAYGYELLNEPAKAKACIQHAMIANVLNFQDENFEKNPEQSDFISYYELNLSYIAKVEYYTKLGDKASLLKAVSLLEASDKLMKSKAIDLKNPKDRLELSQLNSFFTEAAMLAVDKLYQLTRDPSVLERAFYYSERSKANELLTDIQSTRAATVSGVSKKTREQRASITTRMNTLQQQIASAYNAKNYPLITKLKAQEVDLSKEYELLQKEIIQESPAFGILTNQRSLSTWYDVKMTLDDRTAIVSYVVTDSSKYILIGNKSKLVMKKIPPKTNLEKLVRVYVNQIKYQSSAMKQLASQLTDILWLPVEQVLPELGMIENIIILPEGPLNYLPFESLGKDHYLAEKYTIRYQFSGALLVNAGQSIQKNKPSLIAMAPVFKDKETNFVNKSCERFVKAVNQVDSTNRAFTLNGQYISPLPATEVEVEKINQIHIDKGLLSKYFLHEAANEAVIKKGELANYDYIHLATHGFVNTKYPELSGVLLSQDATLPEDGILYTGEILGLTFKANLVTLSACETALGKRVEGEGVRGLTSSFLVAGARNVVASLWKVADECTSILMITFYNEILSGKDKATALRVAKQKLIADQKFNHPYYWAPFIQVGSN